MEETIIKIKAPAKVNLFLKVVGKRPDGYHELVSVMQALELSDEIEASRLEGGIDVSCDRPGVPAGRQNIAYRAAEALLGEAGVSGGVRIHIKKNIPMAAGMGGGSSDAAAVLKAVGLLYGIGLPDARMREIALSLGADVPFFLSWPCSRAEGVGERLTEMAPPGETWMVVVNPGFEVPTKWVYENLNFRLTKLVNNITLPAFTGRTGEEGDAGLMASYLYNDLERVTADRHPLIREIKFRLTERGALGALMSGSGPTVFGIFPDRHAAAQAAEAVKEPGWTVAVTRTITAWPKATVASKKR